ncbi:MAG: response regulator transcription factor [Ruminococcaceae bacterium]|nr:response regulator transcription factor [Oscillospiraceae bacterium]
MELGEKIIVADDESRITSLVGDFLSAAGYKPVLASDGAEALAAFSENRDAAAVILDIMMPELNGWEVCREIRKQSSVPIILLTARAEEFDQLMGFEAGADEYVTKPFSPAVLVKRVEALIRRSKTREQDGDRGLRIEREAFVAYLDGKELELTVKEFEILNHLFENKGRVFSRDQILAAVWGYDFEGDPRTVDSHVARLRLKLGDYGNMHIKTVYGLGYKFEV